VWFKLCFFGGGGEELTGLNAVKVCQISEKSIEVIFHRSQTPSSAEFLDFFKPVLLAVEVCNFYTPETIELTAKFGVKVESYFLVNLEHSFEYK
jgi:hypothetical protein